MRTLTIQTPATPQVMLVLYQCLSSIKRISTIDDSSEHSPIGNTNQPSIIDHNATSSLDLTIAAIDHMVPSFTSHTLPIIDNFKGSLSVDGTIDGGLIGDGQESLPMGTTASAEFGETLKIMEVMSYGHGTFLQTGPVVASFNSAKFIKFCDKASSDYDPKYCEYFDFFDNLGLLQVGKVWCSCDLLVQAMELLAKYHGFTIWQQKKSPVCNQSMDMMTCEHSHRPLKSGCSFHFKLSSLETEQYMPQGSTIHKWHYKKRWTRMYLAVPNIVILVNQTGKTISLFCNILKNMSMICPALLFTCYVITWGTLASWRAV